MRHGWRESNELGGGRLLRLKRLALDQGVNELADGVIPGLGSRHDFIRELFVGETEWAAEGVFNKVLDQAAGEVVFALDNEVAQFPIVRELRSVVELAGGIYGGGPFAGTAMPFRFMV